MTMTSLRKNDLTGPELDSFEFINGLKEEIKNLDKKLRDMRQEVDTHIKMTTRQVVNRHARVLKQKIKTLPKKLKDGRRVSYKIEYPSGFVMGYYLYRIPTIRKTVYEFKTPVKVKKKVSSDLERIIDEMGYKLVKK